MTSFRPWLVPTLVGPFATMWTLVTLAFLLAGQAQILGERLDTWAVAMLITGFLAAGHVVALLVADVLLLGLKLRRLPTGGRAWASSMLSPFALQLLWMLPVPVESFFGLAVWIAVSMLAAVTLVRLAFGTPPAR
jgi:hypothetical protein